MVDETNGVPGHVLRRVALPGLVGQRDRVARAGVEGVDAQRYPGVGRGRACRRIRGLVDDGRGGLAPGAVDGVDGVGRRGVPGRHGHVHLVRTGLQDVGGPGAGDIVAATAITIVIGWVRTAVLAPEAVAVVAVRVVVAIRRVGRAAPGEARVLLVNHT